MQSNQSNQPITHFAWLPSLNESYMLGLLVFSVVAAAQNFFAGNDAFVGFVCGGFALACLPQLLLSRYVHFNWTSRKKAQQAPTSDTAYFNKAGSALLSGIGTACILTIVVGFVYYLV
jgi:hypothetical protein